MLAKLGSRAWDENHECAAAIELGSERTKNFLLISPGYLHGGRMCESVEPPGTMTRRALRRAVLLAACITVFARRR
jgi:hypothetical protein